MSYTMMMDDADIRKMQLEQAEREMERAFHIRNASPVVVQLQPETKACGKPKKVTPARDNPTQTLQEPSNAYPASTGKHVQPTEVAPDGRPEHCAAGICNVRRSSCEERSSATGLTHYDRTNVTGIRSSSHHALKCFLFERGKQFDSTVEEFYTAIERYCDDLVPEFMIETMNYHWEYEVIPEAVADSSGGSASVPQQRFESAHRPIPSLADAYRATQCGKDRNALILWFLQELQCVHFDRSTKHSD